MRHFKSAFIVGLIALSVVCATGRNAIAQEKDSGTRLLLGISEGEQHRWTGGVAIRVTKNLWSVSSVDLDFQQGDKKMTTNIAVLFDIIKVKLPFMDALGGLKAGPIMGGDFEHTNAGNPSGDALEYLKGAAGIAGGFWWDDSGLWFYYKAAIELEDAQTTPLKPTWGINIAIGI